MLAPGTEIGRYVVRRKLAEGGMAEIYLASAVGPEGFSKDVAIKVIRSFLASDQQFVQMFIAEARLASRLNHANVVQIFDFGKHEDTYYLAMEYVRGGSLWELRRRCREQGVPFPPTLAAEIGAQVARGLQYAHSLSDRGQKLGVVHRDVTPHNVLLSMDGAAKLTDFGIAKATTSHTAPGMLKGKFAYMSPEQARGERVDARTDIFALGIVLWELLTGGRLFEGDSEVAVLRAVENAVIAPPARINPDVPDALSAIVMKALARPLGDRFQTAFELERALATWVLHTAESMEETSVSLFLQQMLPAELETEQGQTNRLASAVSAASAPALGALAVDAALGDTVAVDRSAQRNQEYAALGALTGTPAAPGPRAPNPTPANNHHTEDLPKYRPASRRLTPLVVADEGALSQKAQGDATRAGPTQSQSQSLSLSKSQSQSQSIPQTEVDFQAVTRPSHTLLWGLLALAVLGLGFGLFFILSAQPAASMSETSARPSVALEGAAAQALPSQAPPPHALTGEESPPADHATPAQQPEPVPLGQPTTTTEVRTRETPPVNAPTWGVLQVKAVPFASVYDGKKLIGDEVVGTQRFSLRPGTHEIQFRHPSKTSPPQRITIVAGKTVFLSFDARGP